MTRQELLAIAKPILFNTEMVRALLGGNKTVIRRVVKKKYVDDVLSSPARIDNPDVSDKRFVECLCESPYQVSDYLYVRETYREKPIEIGGGYFYKEEAKEPNNYTWKPSIHMPKEAARIFLRVTDVRVERLQDMNGNDLEKEGIKTGITHFKRQINNYGNAQRYVEALQTFSELWDSTIKKADLDKYGWNANPFCWVIEFERVIVDE